MAQPELAKDALNRVMGGAFWKNGATITTVLWRAFHKVEANTAPDTPLGFVAVTTGKEGDPVTESVVGGGTEIPVLQVGGRDPSGNKILLRINADRSAPISHELASLTSLVDAAANPATSRVGAANLLFNGSTWDRQRGVHERIIYASAARTANPTFVDEIAYNARGLIVVINATALTSAPSVVFTIEGKDSLSGTYYPILVSTALTTAAPTQIVLRVYPGLTAVANLVASDLLPRVWRVTAVHANGNSITYSVGAILLP